MEDSATSHSRTSLHIFSFSSRSRANSAPRFSHQPPANHPRSAGSALLQGFQINDHTGSHLSDEEMMILHAERVQGLQRLCFKHVPKLMELAMSTVRARGH